jgi:ATP synthase protein I
MSPRPYGPRAFSHAREGAFHRTVAGENMSEHAPDPEDLRALGERIDALKRQEAPPPRKKGPTSGEVAIRFATELLSAVIVGAAIGWGLDWLFGTRPALTIAFFVVGAAAGIRNVIVASKEITRRDADAAAAEEAEKER